MNTSPWPSPGCMTKAQISTLKAALENAGNTPSLLCDLEGAGPVAELEAAFARVCGVPYALALSSGTAAIHAALLAAGIEPGDEVIVTPYSWPQSVSPVLFCGAVPVFADIDPISLNLDPGVVKKLVSAKTKAIIAVHIFGNPADMSALKDIAAECGAALIADAAHGLGATLHGRPVGAWGGAACFSLGRGKLVCGGEGGILVTANAKLYENALALTQHTERLRRYSGPRAAAVFSLNYRLHPLAALLALCDLEHLNTRLGHRRQVLSAVYAALDGSEAFTLPAGPDRSETAAYGIPLGFANIHRHVSLVAEAQSAGLPLRCGPVKEPLHLVLNGGDNRWAHLVASSALPGSCPVAEAYCRGKELWLLSAMDMDVITPPEAGLMGERLRQLAEKSSPIPRM